MEVVRELKSIKEEAEAEIAIEKQKAAKEKIKIKLRERDKAQLIVRNIERELEDLMVEISG